jgi:uncharacterized protein (DUF1499 family)
MQVLKGLLLITAPRCWYSGGPAHAAVRHPGPRDGRLRPPSKTPNSVSSQADLWAQHPMQDYARIAPLALKGSGPATMAQIKRIVEAARHKVVESRRLPVRAVHHADEVRRRCGLDPTNQVVQLRSASRRPRIWRHRARIEAIRQALASS